MLYKDYVERKTANAIRINSAEGYPCVFDNSKGRPLKDYKIYGNSIQDGTPTPESPVEVQSVGDLVTDAESEYYGKYDIPIVVNDTTTHIYLNEPLRKVGDYADYIDFKKGTVVRNVVELNLLSKQVAELYTYSGKVGIRTNAVLREIMQRRGGKCNRVETGNIGYFFNKNSMWLGVNSLMIYWIGILDILGLSTLNEFKEWLDNNPTYIYYGIEASAEEDIELPKILTQKGSNIITAATVIEPSNIQVKYIEK